MFLDSVQLIDCLNSICSGIFLSINTQRSHYFTIFHNLHLKLVKPVFSYCSNYISRSFNVRYQGHISAALVLGGVDVTGPRLYSIYPHGSTDSLPYVTMGMYIHCDRKMNKKHHCRQQTKFREGNVFTRVCLFTGGGGLSSHNAVGQADPTPPPCHTVNRRAEGILLECMLVNFSLSCQFCNFDYFILTNVGNHYLSLIFFQLRLWKFSCHGGLRRWLQTRYDGLFKFLNLILTILTNC